MAGGVFDSFHRSWLLLAKLDPFIFFIIILIVVIISLSIFAFLFIVLKTTGDPTSATRQALNDQGQGQSSTGPSRSVPLRNRKGYDV